MLKKWLIAAFALFSALAGAQTTTQPMLLPHWTFVDSNGFTCSGCLLYSYAAGTTTPLATYSDAAGTVPNTNPVVLDVAGGATIWFSSSAYKFTLKTALGSSIWTVDSVSGARLGTVSSVAMTVPSWLSVSGSPVTGAGTFAVTAASAQTPHKVIGTCGAATTFSPCSLQAGDLPATIGPPTTFLTNAEFSAGTCTTALTVNPANGNKQKVTLTDAATCALTFTQPISGTATVQLKITQSAAGAFSGLISGCKWPGGAVPVITQTSGAIDMLSVYFDGTNAYCQIAQAFS